MLRIRSRLTRIALPLLLAGLTAVPHAAAQGPGIGVSRERMWPAPTEADWAKPCLITWQRTWEDAVTVSRETGKAILVCINMDGEIASEHYAGIRYRQPEIAVLYEPYVTVIASVYRHTPRDYDEEGQRVLCPRFGSVTCGEHITIEPILYEQYLDGRRIAPRHIMVELDQREVYDVFYAFDTDTVFNAVRDGIASREVEPYPDTRGDRTLFERVASADIVDRQAVERAYATGDRELRRRLLESAVKLRELAPLDLLRQAIFGLDLELSRMARAALAQSSSPASIDLIVEALRVPMEPAEREALIEALERIGASTPRAATLAAVFRGLGGESQAVDVDDWSTALESSGGTQRARDRYTLESRVETGFLTSGERIDDAGSHLELAEASLALAVDPRTAVSLAAGRKSGGRYAQLMFEDAHRAALRAEALGAGGWRVEAALALSAYYLERMEEAYARAEAAVAALPSGEESWSAMAVLGIFAEARRKSITDAVRAKDQWPRQWLTDVNAAYSVLARHPFGTDLQVVAHFDFLRQLGAWGPATRVLDEGVARFPASEALHRRLRGRLLWEKGVDGLQATYASMLAEPDAPPELAWFAGYASLVAAEFHRRSGDADPALAAYDRAIEYYGLAIASHPESRDLADHYVAIALAGQARVAYERGDDEAALGFLLASFERREASAASLDGLGLSAVGTAQMLRVRLAREKRAESAARLQAALDALDPELLRLPGFERDRPNDPPIQSNPPSGRRLRPGR